MPALATLWETSEVPNNVIILDACNRYPLRDSGLHSLKGRIESEYIAEQLGRTVVKVYDNIVAYTLKHKGDLNTR